MTDINPNTQPVPFGANAGWHGEQQAAMDRQVYREQLAAEGFLGTGEEAEAEVDKRIAKARGIADAEPVTVVPVADVAVTTAAEHGSAGTSELRLSTVPETVAMPETPVA